MIRLFKKGFPFDKKIFVSPQDIFDGIKIVMEKNVLGQVTETFKKIQFYAFCFPKKKKQDVIQIIVEDLCAGNFGENYRNMKI